MPRRSPSPRAVLTLIATVALVLALTPSRFSAWVGLVRGPLMTVMAPISGPLAAFSRWARRDGEGGLSAESATASELRALLEQQNTALAQSLERIRELEETLAILQGGVPALQQAEIRRIEAHVVGRNLGGGTIEVNRGRTSEVSVGSAAVARRSEQLVGVVTAVGPMTASVHLITDERLSPRSIRVVVLPAEPAVVTREAIESAPKCLLTPMGDGTLADIYLEADKADRVKAGDVVRLYDEDWPSATQFLIVGRVTRLEPTESPGHRRLTVTPETDPARVRSAILHIPLAPPGAGGGGG